MKFALLLLHTFRFSIEIAKDGLFLRTRGCQPEVCMQLPKAFTIVLRIIKSGNDISSTSSEQSFLNFQITPENVISPRFSQKKFEATVYEKSPYFLETLQLKTFDYDHHDSSKSSTLLYSLTEKSDIFQIDSNTGVLSVKVS